MKKIDRYKKFNMAKWSKDHDTASKKRKETFIFLIKHPIIWLLGAIIASVIIELFK